MKTDVIKSLFTGKPLPCERAVPKDKGYWDLLKESHQRAERFMGRLSPKDKEELECILECRQEAVQYEIEEAFIQGYSLGVRSTAESFLLQEGHRSS